MKTWYSNRRNRREYSTEIRGGGGGKKTPRNKAPKPDLISRPVALPEETSPDNLGNLILLLL